MKLKKMVYLANPYSSKLKNKDLAAYQCANRRNLEALAGGTLRKKYKGYCFLLPIANSAAMADLCTFDTGFGEWVGDDLTFISNCDEVWVLTSPGWKESIGVQAEIAFAESLDGMRVRYVNSKTFKLTNRPSE